MDRDCNVVRVALIEVKSLMRDLFFRFLRNVGYRRWCSRCCCARGSRRCRSPVPIVDLTGSPAAAIVISSSSEEGRAESTPSNCSEGQRQTRAEGRGQILTGGSSPVPEVLDAWDEPITVSPATYHNRNTFLEGPLKSFGDCPEVSQYVRLPKWRSWAAGRWPSFWSIADFGQIPQRVPLRSARGFYIPAGQRRCGHVFMRLR